MIWINIRTVAAEIYLAVSDIPQMSGSVLLPAQTRNRFWKNLPDRSGCQCTTSRLHLAADLLLHTVLSSPALLCKIHTSRIHHLPLCNRHHAHVHTFFHLQNNICTVYGSSHFFLPAHRKIRNLPARFSHTRFLHYSDTHRYRKNQPRHLSRCTTRNHCTPPADDMPRSPCRP